MENLRLIGSVAAEAARRVGERMRTVLRERKSIEVQQKGSHDFFTEIDLWAEREITEKIRAEFPGHTIVGEEYSAQLSKTSGKTLEQLCEQGVCWVVDPLDGTSNFINGIPHSAVSIAVLENGERIFGLVYDPFLDELFTASRGEGAFLNGEPISVSNKSKMVDAIVATGIPGGGEEKWQLFKYYYGAFFINCHKVRNFGAAALEICWVACGRLDAFFNCGLKPWDVAAGSLIVEEAGGSVNCFLSYGQDRQYSIFDRSILVSNQEFFEKMTKLAYQADRDAHRKN